MTQQDHRNFYKLAQEVGGYVCYTCGVWIPFDSESGSHRLRVCCGCERIVCAGCLHSVHLPPERIGRVFNYLCNGRRSDTTQYEVPQ